MGKVWASGGARAVGPGSVPDSFTAFGFALRRAPFPPETGAAWVTPGAEVGELQASLYYSRGTTPPWVATVDVAAADPSSVGPGWRARGETPQLALGAALRSALDAIRAEMGAAQ